MTIGHRRGNDPALLIHADMQFLPALAILFTVFRGMPFALATDFQPRAIDDEVNRSFPINRIN